MKKTTNELLQLILKEQKLTNRLLDKGDKPVAIEKPGEDKPDYIKLEMKDYMTPAYLFSEMKKLFEVYVWVELDGIISERSGDYTVYFKNVQEADEDMKNMSADDIKVKGIKTITLEERLQLEIVYFKKYGKHLDIDNITLCSGSRGRVGSVPNVYWNSDDRKVSVDGCFASDRLGDLRARSASFSPTE